MQWCQKGTGTPESVCVYPALIYHEEDIKPFPLIPYQHFSLDVQGEGNMTTWNYSATPPVEINASIPDWLFNFMFPRILLNQNINITPNATYIINFSYTPKRPSSSPLRCAKMPDGKEKIAACIYEAWERSNQ